MMIASHLMTIAGPCDAIPMILVGNKCDDEAGTREVSPEYAQEFVDKILRGCGYIETSAKTGHNVREAFQVSTTKLCTTHVTCRGEPLT